MKRKIKNNTQIINELLKEKEKRIIVPEPLHTRLKQIRTIARIDLQRVTVEVLLAGLDKIEKKYTPVEK